MKKNTFFKTILFLLIGMSIVSCSNDDDITKKNTELKLTLSKTTITPFEKLPVSIDMDLDLLNSAYDSIRWQYNGTWWDEIIRISLSSNYDRRNRDITDYRLGKNKISLIGYKNGEIKSRTSAEYNVEKPKNDFFLIKWGVSNNPRSNSYNTLYKKVSSTNGILKLRSLKLILTHCREYGTFEHAILEVYPERVTDSDLSKSGNEKTVNTSLPDIDNYDFDQISEDRVIHQQLRTEAQLMTYSFWHSYITLIYGPSISKYDGEDVRETNLWSEYNKRFKNKLENIYPLSLDKYPIEIWETETSYICMYAPYNSFYYVMAEPRR